MRAGYLEHYYIIKIAGCRNFYADMPIVIGMSQTRACSDQEYQTRIPNKPGEAWLELNERLLPFKSSDSTLRILFQSASTIDLDALRSLFFPRLRDSAHGSCASPHACMG
jgi:hypothetical protein